MNKKLLGFLIIGGFFLVLLMMFGGLLMHRAMKDFNAQQQKADPSTQSQNPYDTTAPDESTTHRVFSNTQNPPDMTTIPLYRPEFEGSFGTANAGTAFLARYEGEFEAYLLTAAHLIGEAGGLSRDYEGPEIVSGFEKVTGYPINQQHESISSTTIMPILSAKSMNWSTGAHDLSAFFVGERTTRSSIILAESTPQVGAPVWLFAEVVGRQGAHLYPATVKTANGKWLEYTFNDPLELRATSGAPVVDHLGFLVAVNLGGYTEGGDTVGIGNPIQAIRARLSEAQAQMQ